MKHAPLTAGWLLAALALVTLQCKQGPVLDAPAPATARVWRQDFEFEGAWPEGWSMAATNAEGPLGEWCLRTEADGDRALALVSIPDRSDGHYNLCWSAAPRFRDGWLEVDVLAREGLEDQGGGPIWRVQDAANYYLARYNPLESNFRLYKVVDGQRTQLAGLGDLPSREGWFTIRIEHSGKRIRATLDGEYALLGEDEDLPEEGGVGVWTKADACSSFDNLALGP